MSTTRPYNIINPKLVCMAFFIVLAVLFCLFARFTLLRLIEKVYIPLIPNFLSILLSSAFIAYLFSPALSKKGHWIKFLCIGFSMALSVLISASLIYFFRAWVGGAPIFALAHQWQDYFVIYGSIIAIQISIMGLWAIPITGLAALYYSKIFLPKLLTIEKNQSALEKTSKKTKDENRPST